MNSDKINKRFIFTKNFKKLWNINVTVIPIAIFVLLKVPKFCKGGGRIENQRII